VVFITVISGDIIVSLVKVFPSLRCIRRALQPGCTWLDVPKLAGLPTHLPHLHAKSPTLDTEWRGKKKKPTPKVFAI
jgi:hypothetical protein